ncbi:PspA/IM30 family protein [Marinigracilibium pacificum]|uniref:PspA/IM30 family protein n=1 Tax=Marinigracilibium pacificum TaxID=2729599 RepID=A0A848J289_9BACT|nr:PspA/IM30 family protein [Marinigracilibium pacificum]NMM47302.1 PspA/IM30 family protein [Marinigracilibium pacificum]
MNIFKRLFKIGQSEAHAAVDKLEDPIKLTEQGIRDMKEDLDRSLKSLAEVKAMAIKARREYENYSSKADEYEQKAIKLLKGAQSGSVSSEEADRLATEALTQKDENLKHAARSQGQKAQFETSVEQLEGNIKRLKSKIVKWENELKTLKARVKVSNATKNINKQMAQIDSSDTISMLERMREKVDQEEALAESYGEMAEETRSIDEEIDKTLAQAESSDKAEELAKLKEKLGINNDK